MTLYLESRGPARLIQAWSPYAERRGGDRRGGEDRRGEEITEERRGMEMEERDREEIVGQGEEEREDSPAYMNPIPCCCV